VKHKELEFTTTVSYAERDGASSYILATWLLFACILLLQNNVRLLGLECVRVADANEVTRVINAGNSESML
jgi:hypothetical protein